MRELKRFLVVSEALVIALVFAPAAGADQNPPGCTGAPPSVSFASATIDQLANPVRPGDSIVLGARVTNQADSACDLSGLTVKVRLPGPDGTPSDSYRTLTSGTFLAAGYGVEGFTEVEPYLADLNDDVSSASLEILWQAQAHDGPQHSSISGEGKPLTINLTRPRSDLLIRMGPPSGPSPLLSATTYQLTNTSPTLASGLAAPGLVPNGPDGPRDVLADSNCDSVTYLSGDHEPDTGREPVLDPGETWLFYCLRTYLMPGLYSSQPSIAGVSEVDHRPWPQVIGGVEIPQVEVFGSDLVVKKSHRGDLLADGTGEYKLKVTNSGNLASSGQVVVYDLLPDGLTATAISGEGWKCSLVSLSCHRSDPLTSGLSFPEVTVAVRVAATAPSSLTNSARVSGGGEPAGATGNNASDDPTMIRKPDQPAMPPTVSRFTVGSLKTRNDGSVAIPVSVPGAGRLTVDDATAHDLVRKSTKRTVADGSYLLVAKARKRLRAKLKRTGATRKVRLKITFRPESGKRSTKFRPARFRLR